ncbi:uncharacterized protein LOC135819145 [Sycon ciliatum]|uniref:uncharacterized protein LOC135819145 n=1 Tax=Sycon ciliatum TaxID=27933 RepID=UPI0031F70830
MPSIDSDSSSPDGDSSGSCSSGTQLDLEMDVHPQSRLVFNQCRGDFLLGLELLSLRRAVNESIFSTLLLDMSLDAFTLDLLCEGLLFALERTDILDEEDDASLVCFKSSSRTVFGAQAGTSLTDGRRLALLDRLAGLPDLYQSWQGEQRSDDIIGLALTSGLEEVIVHGTRFNFVLLVCGSSDSGVDCTAVADDAMQKIRQVEKHGLHTRVYCVGIGEGYDRELLQSLADRSHGNFAHAVDGYDAVHHIQSMLAQFSTLVATDTTLTLTSTKVNGRPIIRSMCDVANDGHVTGGQQHCHGNVGGEGKFTVFFGDVFTEESYQRIVRVELDLTAIASEHTALPIASGTVQYSTANGSYEISYSTVLELCVLSPALSHRAVALAMPIPYLLPRPIGIPDEGDTMMTPFIQRHLASEVCGRVLVQIHEMEGNASDSDIDPEQRNRCWAISSECLQLIRALERWNLINLPPKQAEKLKMLTRRLKDEFEAEEPTALEAEDNTGDVSGKSPELEVEQDSSAGGGGTSAVNAATESDGKSEDIMPAEAPAGTAPDSGRRRSSGLHMSARRQSSYQSSGKRDRAKELYAQTLRFTTAKAAGEKLATTPEGVEGEEMTPHDDTTRLGHSSSASKPDNTAASSGDGDESNPPATSKGGDSSVTDAGGEQHVHGRLRNLADDGEMSESIQAIEKRLAESSGQRKRTRGTVRIGDDSELGKRLKQREQKRQELLTKYGKDWADKY